jgi:hypothetical protein
MKKQYLVFLVIALVLTVFLVPTAFADDPVEGRAQNCVSWKG